MTTRIRPGAVRLLPVTGADDALVTGLFVLAGGCLVAALCFLLHYAVKEDGLGVADADEPREPTSRA